MSEYRAADAAGQVAVMERPVVANELMCALDPEEVAVKVFIHEGTGWHPICAECAEHTREEIIFARVSDRTLLCLICDRANLDPHICAVESI